ncbi:MAG: DUF4105 domain-containing protein [Polaribacter sp.]|jgi:hypothetical protein|nr:DUF4105 domain-containing protein [Polaribacter sp.]MDG1954163.1 DUF4105 domain-containing protein [Polaribacter sp.]MDG2073227.1 DUF4105 domain-containing protein [Polaribacter sp.]
MKTKFTFLFLILFVVQITFSQYKKIPDKAEVSIITAGPGKVLYEGFGHSAIRVKSVDFDFIYNYGFFDFNAPNFYLNFTKGKMLYKLERYPFHYFVRSSQRDKRWVKEQVLDLKWSEKQQFFEYLENNAKPDNATYLYDPFFNNCATIIREIAENVLKNKIIFQSNYLKDGQSFRQLMNIEIPWNTWGSFGINLALGRKLDQVATAKQYMYLPDYVYSGFKNAKIIRNGNYKGLIKTDRYILKFNELKIEPSFLNPFLVFTLLLLIGVFITYKDVKRKKRTKWFDFLLFFSTGIIGLLIVFLWFFTNHSTTPINFNFLWAFAPNIIIAFYLLKENPKLWVKTYLKILIILLLSIAFIWIGKIQLLPFAILPIILLLLIRFFYLSKKLLSFKE